MILDMTSPRDDGAHRRAQEGETMRTSMICAVVIAALPLSACVGNLETAPYRERTATLSGALRGVTYALPKRQNEVTLVRRPAECPRDVGEDGKPTALEFDVEVAAAPILVPGEAYTVDYEKLAGWLRTSNFDIKYWPNGTLKSIGAGADDRTAEVIRDVVKTGLAVVTAVAPMPAIGGLVAPSPAPPPPAMMAESPPVEDVLCTEPAAARVREARALVGAFEASEKRSAALLKAIDRIVARAAVKLIDRRDREALLELFDAIDKEEEALAALEEQEAKLDEALGVTDSFIWDSAIGARHDDQSTSHALSRTQHKKLGALLKVGPIAPIGDAADKDRRMAAPACYATNEVGTCLREQLDLHSGVALRAELIALLKAKNARSEAERALNPPAT